MKNHIDQKTLDESKTSCFKMPAECKSIPSMNFLFTFFLSLFPSRYSSSLHLVYSFCLLLLFFDTSRPNIGYARTLLNFKVYVKVSSKYLYWWKITLKWTFNLRTTSYLEVRCLKHYAYLPATVFFLVFAVTCSCRWWVPTWSTTLIVIGMSSGNYWIMVGVSMSCH